MPKETLLRHEQIVFRRFIEPFSLNDIFVENRSDVDRNGAEAALAGPLIEDFSKVDLGQLTSDDIRRYVRKFEQADVIPREISNNYVVCVARDKVSFGMLRMFGIYAELAGVRDEENFFVTEDYQEGVDWLMKKMGRTNRHSHDFLEILQRVETLGN